MVLSLQPLVRIATIALAFAVVFSSVGMVFAATYSVTITDDQFVPATLKIKTGDSVTFINSTTATQSARTSATTGFNTGNIGPGSSKTVTLSTAGTFSYSSLQDSTLTGTITVEASELTSTITSTGTGGATGSAVTTKGDMPVSGTTEVLFGMLALGVGFIAFGVFSNRVSFAGTNERETVVELQPVKPYNEVHGRSSIDSDHLT